MVERRNSIVEKNPFDEEEEERLRREEEIKGGLFSTWGILMLAVIVLLTVEIIILKLLGIPLIFLIAFLLIQIPFWPRGKDTKEIMEKIERKLEKHEGEQLDFIRQLQIAKEYAIVFLDYKYVRYVFYMTMNLVTVIFIVTWSLFGIIVSLLFVLVIVLAIAWYATRFTDLEYIKKNFAGVIEKDPPHVGLLTILGEKKEIVLKEGYALRIPHVIDFIPIKVMRETMDLEDHVKKPIKVITKDNVTVKLYDLTIWYTPDFTNAKRLIEFVKMGKHKGVEDALEDLVLSRLRQFARELKVEDTKNEQGEVIEGLLSAKKEITDRILKMLIGNNGTIKEINNGKPIPDARNLGILLENLSMGEAEPQGEYAEKLSMLAKEELERLIEIYEASSEGLRAITYFMSSKGKDISKMTPEDIESYISKKAEEDPAFKKEFMQFLTLVLDYKTDGVIPGLGDRLRREDGSIPFDMIGGLISGLIPKPLGEKKPRGEKDIGGNKPKKDEKTEEETQED